ncbi:MAG: hypothetical protein EHM35_11215, partial [Planctomycetaceae bacterium]
LGLDLGPSGVMPNDPGDTDEGANNLQNYPEISSVLPTSVQGTLNSIPNTTFVLDFYRQEICDSSHYGEGEIPLDTTTTALVTTDVNGNAAFSFEFTTPVSGFVTATATAPDGSTSEFSACRQTAGALSGPLVVTSTASAGGGTLASAVSYANSHGGGTITFNLAGSPPYIIEIYEPLVLKTSITIDGTSQPGYTDHPLIEVRPTRWSQYNDGIKVTGQSTTFDSSLHVTIRGLCLYWFPGAAIKITNGQNHRIEWNYIGLNSNVTYWYEDLYGISVQVPNTVIRENVIVGTRYEALELFRARNTTVTGNYIGLTPDGQYVLENWKGILIRGGATDNQIGGLTPESRNYIVGSTINGIEIESTSQYPLTTTNTILGNMIAYNATAIYIDRSGGNTIGGTVGTFPGGPCMGACNLISGNSIGIVIANGLADPGLPGNIIQGNFIGTNIYGTAAWSNEQPGISINGTNTIVGGTTPQTRNLISANGTYGIVISGASSANNTIQGNLIGTDTTGTLDLGNGSNGIFIGYGASGNLIGGDSPEAGNLIGFNKAADGGLKVTDGTRNTILNNRFASNAGLGIQLGIDGVTLNDTGDGDSGANNLQNFPVLTQVIPGPPNVRVGGVLDSTPNTTFTVQFFHQVACDVSGHGEGDQLIGQTSVTTDGSGQASFVAIIPGSIPEGHVVTATATDPSGNTSEFS